MKKALSLALVGLIVFSTFSTLASQVKAQEVTLFSDDFESYDVGTRPSPPWEFWFNTNGEITSTTYISPTKSLRLTGSYGWSTEAIRRFTSSSQIIGFEVYGKVETIGRSLYACFTHRTGSGTADIIAAVIFWSDGMIYATSTYGSHIGPLQSYTANTWYKIRVVLDRSTRLYSVWIDDVLKITSVEVPEEIGDLYTNIDGLNLISDWGAVNCYFDNARVFEIGVQPSLYSLYVQSSPVTGVFITCKKNDYVEVRQTDFTITEESPFTITLTAPLSYENYEFSCWLLDGINMGEGNSLTVNVDDQHMKRLAVAKYEKVRRFFGWVFGDTGSKYTSGNTTKDFYEHVDQFKFVSPCWYIVNNSGEIVNDGWGHFDFNVDFARENGVLVLPKFGNQLNPNYTKIFSNETADKIADFVSTTNVDGINIDFESIPNGPWLGVNTRFTTFISRLTDRLHAQSKIVTVAVEVGWWAQLFPSIDYKALGQIVDYLIPMVYPYRIPLFPNLRPVCLSPTWWMKSWAQRLINTYKVPSEKLIIAIPVYGVDWEQKSRIHWEPTEITFNQAEDITNNRAKGEWDASTGTWHYAYEVNGVKHELWYFTSRSVEERIDILSSMGMKYIAIWAVGQEDPLIWNTTYD